MDDLSEREQAILFHVIDDFIRHGEPVASSTVAAKDEIEVSPATIRNVMADLERGGYLVQPHTSAGRVPTAVGIRRYVDLLLRFGTKAVPEVPFDAPPDEGVAQWASALLSDASNMAGLVLGPDPHSARIRDVRLIALSPRRVLAIFVDDEGSTFERVTHFEDAIDPVDLIAMQNYLQEMGAGLSLRGLRAKVRAELTETRTAYRRFVRQALALADEATRDQRADLHVEGAFKFVEFANDLDHLRELLRALEERERVIEILDQVYAARRPIILVGPESNWNLGDELSFVLCGFYRGLDQAGLVGVLGPMRMDYARVIPLVDHVARVLSRELENRV